VALDHFVSQVHLKQFFSPALSQRAHIKRKTIEPALAAP
jgi:hypothetical protein